MQNRIEEVRMRNKNRNTGQAKLPFERVNIWAALPEPVRERCRMLIRQMLSVVLQSAAGRPDERED